MDNSYPIVLIGPMASGKSTIGTLLAGLLEAKHYDTDAEVVRSHGSVKGIFAEYGEERFRILEKQCAQELLKLAQKNVISLGGGAPLRLRKELSERTVVYLEATWSDVAQRLTREELNSRPILGRHGIEEAQRRWEKLLQERRGIYQALATLTVSVSGKTPDEIANEIIKKIMTA